MLKHLEIDNVVLIDRTSLDLSDFKRGLCILSGETGSGKSILLDAFGLAIGLRSNLRLIGSAREKACVFAEFDIKENKALKEILRENFLLDEENENNLKIRRVIDKNSASKAFVNDQNIGINLLAKIGDNLVEIHGQHDQRGLLDPSNHEKILDEFAQNSELLKALKKIYDELRQCDEKISDFELKKDQLKREEDYLNYIIKELENADVKSGEEDELRHKKDRLTSLEKIFSFLEDFKLNLTEANSQLMLAQRGILRNQNLINSSLEENKDFFEKINIKIDEKNAEIEADLKETEILIRDLNNNDENLEEIEERLFLIKNLGRKFNTNGDGLALILNDAHEKLSMIEKQDEISSDLVAKKKKFLEEYKKIAAQISQKRKKSATILSQKVEDELKFLKMQNVKFLVEIKEVEIAPDQYFPSGNDKIRFFASINKNNPDDISKIASGGELSRFMLALKVALMDIKSVPTMIFDEIDTGIGGSVANAVGERLKILSKNLQIFVVTHQPQIAAKSDLHFKISKSQKNERVNTLIEKLENDKKIKEVARMISGEDISEEAIAAARKLF